MDQPIAWETVPCPLCGCRNDREFLKAAGDAGHVYRLSQCSDCDTVYTNPRPTAASIGRFYPEGYAPYQPPKQKRQGLRERLGFERRLSDRIPRPAGGALLDYGCGSGWFAARMRDRGWDATGMDFSPHAVMAARANFGLKVVHGTLPHPAVPAGSFDAVTVRAVLEHLHDPAAALRGAFAALRPGGWLYVSVPNLASWGYGAFGPRWFNLDLPRHLTHFTPDTLRELVKRAGFEVEAVTTRGHSKWMRESARHAAGFWAKACRSRLVASAVTTWTGWAGRGDELALLAQKPNPQAPALRWAA